MIKMTVVLTLLLGLLTVFPSPLQAESLVIVTGVISEDGQLIGNDGVIYEISDNKIGIKLMEMTDNRVKVRGKVIVDDDAVIIVVEEFEKVRK